MHQLHVSPRRMALHRTAQGQAELIRPRADLDALERRLLGLINGYTDLYTLSLILKVDSLEHAARKLVKTGLAEATVKADHPDWERPHPHPWSDTHN